MVKDREKLKKKEKDDQQGKSTIRRKRILSVGLVARKTIQKMLARRRCSPQTQAHQT